MLYTVMDLERETKVSRYTWRAWIRDGRIPCVRIGRSVRVPDKALRQFLAQNMVPIQPAASKASKASNEQIVNEALDLLTAPLDPGEPFKVPHVRVEVSEYDDWCYLCGRRRPSPLLVRYPANAEHHRPGDDLTRYLRVCQPCVRGLASILDLIQRPYREPAHLKNIFLLAKLT